MKTVARYIMPAIIILSILFFSVSATMSFADARTMVGKSFSEPINMILIGFVLIGFGNFLKKKSLR